MLKSSSKLTLYRLEHGELRNEIKKGGHHDNFRVIKLLIIKLLFFFLFFFKNLFSTFPFMDFINKTLNLIDWNVFSKMITIYRMETHCNNI